MSSHAIEVSVSLTEQQSRDLLRFHETTEDGQGYDVPAERMKALARVGLIRSTGFKRYEFTNVGSSVVTRLRAKPVCQTCGGDRYIAEPRTPGTDCPACT
jgi:hypothetical protein